MQDKNSKAVSSRPRWAVAAMFFANGFILGGWAPQLPLFLTRLGITESTLGLLLVGFGLGALVAMPAAGWFITRYGSRSTLIAAAIACSPALLVVVAAPSLAAAAAAFIVLGAVIGSMDVSMNANAVAVERRLGRAVMSSSHGFWSLGGFAGGATGGFLIEQFGPLGHAAIVSVIAIALVIAAMPHIAGDDRPDPAQRRSGGLPRSPTVYLLGVIALFAMIPEGAVIDWGALFLTQDLWRPLATAGFGYAAFAGAMAVMRFVGDGLRDRFGGVNTLRVSAIIASQRHVGRSVCAQRGGRHRLLRACRSWHRQYRACRVSPPATSQAWRQARA
jgi:predicted MFS family arabinose efflux permease